MKNLTYNVCKWLSSLFVGIVYFYPVWNFLLFNFIVIKKLLMFTTPKFNLVILDTEDPKKLMAWAEIHNLSLKS